MIAGLLASPRLILAGLGAAAVVAAGLYVWNLRSTVADLEDRNAVLRANYETAINAAATNAAAFDAERAAHRRTAAALEAASARDVARARRITRLEEAARHAPKSDDGPVAPVLRRILDGLRDAAGDAPGAGDPDPSARSAAGPAGLPAAAGTARP